MMVLSGFKHLMATDQFLSKAENAGLVLCSDGVPAFKSSKGSLWPVYLIGHQYSTTKAN